MAEGPRSSADNLFEGNSHASPTSRSARRSADVRCCGIGPDGNNGVQGRNDLRHDGARRMYGSRWRRQERHEEERGRREGRAEGCEQGAGGARRCNGRCGAEAGRCDGDLWRRHQQQGGPRCMRAAWWREDRECDARAGGQGCGAYDSGVCASGTGGASGRSGDGDHACRQHRSHRRYRAVQGWHVLSRDESSWRVRAPSGRREVAVISA